MNSIVVSRVLPLAAALIAAFPVSAQSLLELYESARVHDAAVRSAHAQFNAAVFRGKQARAGLLPAASLSAGILRNQYDNTAPPVDRGFGTQNVTLSASQPLYRPANRASFEQGQRAIEVAGAQLSASVQDLIIRLSGAYFDVLAAADTLAFVQAQKSAVNEQLSFAKRSFEAGTTTITDTREAQARFDLVAAQEIAAENDLRVRRLALDSLVGHLNARPLPLAVPATLPSPVPADPDAWVSQAEADSPVIRQARINVEIARLETEKAQAGHKPTVDLVASYNITRNPEGNLTTALGTRGNNAQIGVLLNVPLFTGFATQNRIRETLALEERSEADLEAVRRNVAQATRTAYFGVVSGQSQVRALEAAEASSQTALDASRVGYQVGVRINIDVLNSQSQLFQTKRDLAQARYNVLLGYLRLRQSNGTLSPEDLSGFNTILAK